MKILQCGLTIDLADGGPVRALIDLSNALVAHGHEVRVSSFGGPDVPGDWEQGRDDRPALVCITPPGPGGLLGHRTRREMTELVRWADVVHLHRIWAPPTPQFAALCRRAGTPYVVSVRGMLDDWCMTKSRAKKAAFLAVSGNAMLRRAAVVHLTAQAEYEQAKKFFPPDRGAVVPNLLDLSPFESLPGPDLANTAFGLSPDESVVLFLSRVHPKKRVEVLIDAAKTLRDAGGDCPKVLIAGTGPDDYTQRMQARIDAESLGDRVRLIGMVTGETKISLYQRADLFCLPTHQENWGFVFIEALACGTPVVTTKGVDIWPELLESGGAMIEPAEPAAYADAIARALADRGALREMGERGRAWVFENLTETKILARWDEVFGAALAGSSPPLRMA